MPSRLLRAAPPLALVLALVLVLVAAPTVPAAEVQGPGPNDGLAARTVLGVLKTRHLLRRDLDAALAGRALDAYLEQLDPNKTFFIRADIDDFRRARADLADQLKKGDVALACQVYRRYQQRVAEVVQVLQGLLGPDARHDFSADEVVVLSGAALDFPKDARERAERWRLTVKHELLRLKYGSRAKDFDLATTSRDLLRYYERFARGIDRTSPEQVLGTFLAALVRQYDPQSTYLAPAGAREFQAQLAGTLTGIGIQWQDQVGGFILQEVIPGGPAERDGRLRPGDRIVSIGQGPSGPLADVTGLTLTEAVDLIRGKAGTTVRLGVVHEGETDIRTFALQRGLVRLPDARLTAAVHEVDRPGGSPVKVGLLRLPTFYSGATADVRARLQEFTTQGADGVVLDLRGNTGGYLNECLSLPGLFLGKGTVLLSRDGAGTVSPHASTIPLTWVKPVVVLTDRQTASGAEIVCAALQDANRGLLVGDESTYGNGTVQQLAAVADHVSGSDKPADLGTLKYTWAQFYRPSGDSLEKRGVLPDVLLPSLAGARPDESRSSSPIGFDRVPPAAVRNHGMLTAAQAEAVRSASQARRRSSADFAKVHKRLEWERGRRQRLVVPLQEDKFRADRQDHEPPALPVARDGESDCYLTEVLAIARDYMAGLGGKTARPEETVVAAPVTSTSARVPTPSPSPAPAPTPIPIPPPAVPAPVFTPPAPVAPPPPAPNNAALRRGVEIQILDVERSIERAQEDIARWQREVRDWDQKIQEANQKLRDPNLTNTQRFLLGGVIGFSLTQKNEASQKLGFAQSSLNGYRDRLVQLRQDLIRYRD